MQQIDDAVSITVVSETQTDSVVWADCHRTDSYFVCKYACAG